MIWPLIGGFDGEGLGSLMEDIMAIITISRGTFSGGQMLAECVAEKLGYRCISRLVLVKGAERYGASLEKLAEAVEVPPRFLEGLAPERARYLAYIRATLCKEVRGDNVVYHGHAGHLLIRGLPHLIRLRVVADMEFRIEAAMQRNKLKRQEAIEFIKKVDEKRVRWTRFLYHVDWHDPSLYDLVINIDRLDVHDACEIVSHTAGLDRFKTTPEARKMMDDLVLSTEVRATIAMNKGISDYGIEVEADGGVITLGGTTRSLEDADKIREVAWTVPGVKSIDSKMQVRSPW